MKSILFCLLALLSLNANAQVDSEQWQTPAFKQHVLERLETLALATLQQNGACSEQALQHALSDTTVAQISDLKLSGTEAQVALVYLAYKAQGRCMGTLPLETLSYLRIAQTRFGEQSALYTSIGQSMLSDREHEAEYEYLYSQLPQAKRQRLEGLAELGVPFNVSALQKLGATP
ncbi:MAG: hypothetical protein GAK45_00827 [Pseudomonas citronellolis]|nr:MAG: hypothetical protein GAK45_00827 [Pseudomonas citronellolis]